MVEAGECREKQFSQSRQSIPWFTCFSNIHISKPLNTNMQHAWRSSWDWGRMLRNIPLILFHEYRWLQNTSSPTKKRHILYHPIVCLSTALVNDPIDAFAKSIIYFRVSLSSMLTRFDLSPLRRSHALPASSWSNHRPAASEEQF